MANKKNIKERKLSWYLKAPVRFLSKARNLYVNGMNRLSPHFNSVDAAFGCPAAASPVVLPRSFSTSAAVSSSASNDYKELVRANSVPHRRHGGLDLSPLKQTQPPPPAKVSKMAVSRSRSVGIERINEDEPCEFEDDLKTKPLIDGRSRSYAVRRSSGVNFFK